MGGNYDYSVLSAPEEAVRCSEIMAQSFVVNPEDELHYLHQAGLENVRVIRQGSEIVGGLVLLPMGQWFGGRRVTMTGVASVAIAPHVRGQGAATFLMTSVVQELASQGIALSTLYPAVQGLYKKVGYGLGGSRYSWRMATHQIQVNHSPLPWYPCPVENVDSRWRTLPNSMGQRNQGNLDRHPLIWHRLLNPPGDGTLSAYGLGPDQPDQGYLLTYQERTAGGTILTIRDWAAPTLAGMQSLWALLFQQRAQIDEVRWAGSAVDALALALPEPGTQTAHPAWWMTRILDVSQALSQRGYPSRMDGELHLELQDTIVARNHGRFVLRVRGGRGTVAAGGRGDMTLHIRHLATLFTGMRSAQELHVLGLMQAPSETVSFANDLFTGPMPWMADFF